ncbi:ABC transporter permease [Ahrensia kielensis]|uniref:ABC transporter permease n=1 Tax=Ahrensia kielensis TaxID=76980 RepID=UPI00036D8105|nr:ABC transporter permease [Ahrensia kielensis]
MKIAINDISDALKKIDIALVFGWQDVSQRYRRSRIGAFWITINMAVMIVALGIIFGTLFRMPMEEFLPQVAAGLIVWTFFMSVIMEGGASYIEASATILQVKMPFSTHIIRVLWRNLIIMAHNIIIIPFILIFFMKPMTMSVFLLPLGMIIGIVNVLWMAIFLSIVCTRFRDVPMIVQNVMQICFYATPIMWAPSILPDGMPQLLIQFNPFYHLLQVVRMPMLSETPDMVNWIVCISMAFFGWILALVFFDRYQQRITYWL